MLYQLSYSRIASGHYYSGPFMIGKFFLKIPSTIC
jgi:hypothetical protein